MQLVLFAGEALGLLKIGLAVCGCGPRIGTEFVIQTVKNVEIRCSLRTNRKKLLNHTSIFIKIIVSSVFTKQTVIDAGADHCVASSPHWHSLAAMIAKAGGYLVLWHPLT